MSRHITNLESEAKLQAAVDAAQQAIRNAKSVPDLKSAEAALNVAKFKLADRAHTLRKIELENGPISLGEPQATPWKTAEAIKADGIEGVYRQGAGTPKTGPLTTAFSDIEKFNINQHAPGIKAVKE